MPHEKYTNRRSSKVYYMEEIPIFRVRRKLKTLGEPLKVQLDGHHKNLVYHKIQWHCLIHLADPLLVGKNLSCLL